jgi:hypothetical protein
MASTGDRVTSVRTPERGREAEEVSSGYGWLIYAGTILAIVGSLNVIYGIAAISNSRFFAQNVTYVISDNIRTWGWVLLILGAIQFLAAFAIIARVSWGRWVGVLTAGLNAIAQMIFLPARPFLSLALFALDVLVIYGLLSHFREPAPS